MGECNVPGGEVKYNSFKLFHKMKLFRKYNVCTLPVFLAIILLLPESGAQKGKMPLCAPLSICLTLLLLLYPQKSIS